MMMKRKIGIVLGLSLMLAATMGCERLCDDGVPPGVPTGVVSVTGDGYVRLSWHPNSERDLVGYRIYRHLEPGGWYEHIASTRYASFTDRDVVNGVTYYYAVSAYDEDGNESGLSEETIFDTPRPEGRGLVLRDYLTSPGEAGYNFSAYEVVAYDDPAADIYYEYDWDWDIAYLNIGHLNTDIQDFGYVDDLDDVNYAPEAGWSSLGWVEAIEGHAYIIWTWDNHFAKLRITEMGDGWMSCDWAYQIDSGNRELAPPPDERGGEAAELEGSGGSDAGSGEEASPEPGAAALDAS